MRDSCAETQAAAIYGNAESMRSARLFSRSTTEGELSMENSAIQLARPAIKHNGQYVQVFVIDGCTVKVSFLSEASGDGSKSTLDAVRNILLAPSSAE